MSWVIRDDFPRSRRGYDRDAVHAHLREVEEEMEAIAASTRMSGRAAEGVRRVVQAAEQTLAELANEAQLELERAAVEAEGIRAAARREAASQLRAAGADDGAAELEAEAARHEAAEIVAEARRRGAEIVAEAEVTAASRVDEADRAVAAFVARATEMGRRVEAFGAELGADGPERVNGSGPELPREPSPPRGRRFQPGSAGGSIPPRPLDEDGAPAPPAIRS